MVVWYVATYHLLPVITPFPYTTLFRSPEALSPVNVALASNAPPLLHKFPTDRKSTRLNSSHTVTSYAAFLFDKNVTPSSTGESAPTSATDGTAVLGQIVQGQPPLAATIVILSAREAVCTGVLESVTCTVTLLVPVVVGVPEICPPEDSHTPDGSATHISKQL